MQNQDLLRPFINQQQHRPALARRQPVEPSTNQFEGAHILIVDDDEPLRNLLQVALQQVGYRVYAAANGQETLAVFDQTPMDLVLLDLILPAMGGYILCAELRKRSDVPIVILSALNHPDDIVYGLSLGADDYIAKPFRMQEIKARIQVVLWRSIGQKGQANLYEHGGRVIARALETYEARG